MDKKTLKIIIAVVISALLLLILLPDRQIMVTVNKGESAASVASQLQKKRIILSKSVFLALVKITGSSNEIKAGNYKFGYKDNSLSVLAKLRNGQGIAVKFTVPEGSSVKQTAEIIAASGINIDVEKFIKIANQKKVEGYLMPETYFAESTTSEEALINMMRKEFDKKVTADMHKRAKELNMTMEKIIVLASIIEKEAVKADERPIISGVFHNRLKKRIRLESCATVLYALGKNKPRLSYEDLKVDSPYNTYKVFGLPPGPICSPGIASIKAALYPTNTSSLFFVSAGNGGHMFSETLEQHNRNKNATRNK